MNNLLIFRKKPCYFKAEIVDRIIHKCCRKLPIVEKFFPRVDFAGDVSKRDAVRVPRKEGTLSPAREKTFSGKRS